MDWFAVVIVAAWCGLGFLGRMLVQRARTGSYGLRLPSRSTPVIGHVGHSVFTVGLLLQLVGALLVATDTQGAWRLPEPVRLAGGLAAVAGVVALVGVQLAMGASWRIGVDPTEETALVTSGPFRRVRNPIFSTMIATGLGLVVLVPSVWMLAGAVGLIAGVELTVRAVEEPYLRRVHGDAYLAYARAAGRFLPGVGQLGR
jgi:protein-S-isoprenylcysteine O-methyltransferase Ste14